MIHPTQGLSVHAVHVSKIKSPRTPIGLGTNSCSGFSLLHYKSADISSLMWRQYTVLVYSCSRAAESGFGYKIAGTCTNGQVVPRAYPRLTSNPARSASTFFNVLLWWLQCKESELINVAVPTGLPLTPQFSYVYIQYLNAWWRYHSSRDTSHLYDTYMVA